MAGTGLQIQVGRPMPTLAEAVAVAARRYPRDSRRAARIDVLPSEVSLASLGASCDVSGEPWRIPYGVRETDLGPAELVLYENEHALIAGPARSGKSTTLLTLAQSLRAAPGGADLYLAATGGRRSPLLASSVFDRTAGQGGEATAMLAVLRAHQGPVVMFIDDAEQFDDADGAITGLLSAARADLHVIAAGRSDILRSSYGHWAKKTLAVSKIGVIIRPNIDLDGELLGATLPRRSPVRMMTGRGYAVHNGDIELVQVALPHEQARP
jgi:S-DNA-T family DNA segregation ATPase FtsK/SpoIIIE